jgi:hypothetical protein
LLGGDGLGSLRRNEPRQKQSIRSQVKKDLGRKTELLARKWESNLRIM